MDDAPWSLALAQVAEFAGAVGVGLGMQDMQTHEFRSLGAAGIRRRAQPDLPAARSRQQDLAGIGRTTRAARPSVVMPKGKPSFEPSFTPMVQAPRCSTA